MLEFKTLNIHVFKYTFLFCLAHYKSGLTGTQKNVCFHDMYFVLTAVDLEKWGTQIIQEPSHHFVLSFGKADK